MITLLKKSTYKESLWKNGKGKTSEIAIYPSGSSLQANDFFWRISSAEVTQSAWFSLFNNCERKLVTWKGAGLLLNKKLLLPNIPLTFSGEDKIYCEVIHDQPVVDFGIIYKKSQIKAELNILKLENPIELILDDCLHFFFLAQSNNDDAHIAGHQLFVGDCLKIEKEKSLSFHSNSPPSIFYHIKISGI